MELIGFKQYITEIAPIIGALGRLAGGAGARVGGKAIASGAASGVVRGAASAANQGNQDNQQAQVDPNATDLMVDRASGMQTQNVNDVKIRSAVNATPATPSRTGPNAVGPDSVHGSNSSILAGQALQMGQLYGVNNVGTKNRR